MAESRDKGQMSARLKELYAELIALRELTNAAEARREEVYEEALQLAQARVQLHMEEFYEVCRANGVTLEE